MVREGLVVERRHLDVALGAVEGDRLRERAFVSRRTDAVAVRGGARLELRQSRRPIPSPRADSATHMRLMSDAPPG